MRENRGARPTLLHNLLLSHQSAAEFRRTKQTVSANVLFEIRTDIVSFMGRDSKFLSGLDYFIGAAF